MSKVDGSPSGCRFGGGQSESRTRAPPARCISLGAYPRSRATPARPRQLDHLRRRAALHRADAARSGLRGRVRPLEGRRRAPRRRVRRRRALRRDPGRARGRAVRAEAGRGRRARAALGRRASRSRSPTARSRSEPHASSRASPAPRRGPGRSRGSRSPRRASDAARSSEPRSASRSSERSSARCSAGSPSSSAIELAFAVVGVVALAFAGTRVARRAGAARVHVLRRASACAPDQRFVGGLWLNMLPAMLFGLLIVLAPLALDDAGWGTFAIAAVFFGAGLVEVVLNPLLGRFTDRRAPPADPRRARRRDRRRARARGELDGRADRAARLRRVDQLRQPLHAGDVAHVPSRRDGRARPGPAFGVMNTAWAFGELVGPTAGGALAESAGDAVPYAVGACLCALTLGGDLPRHGKGEPSCSVRTGTSAYASVENLWAVKPNRFLVAEVAELPARRALDLACGEGRTRSGSRRSAGRSRRRLLRGRDREGPRASRARRRRVDFVCADLVDVRAGAAPSTSCSSSTSTSRARAARRARPRRGDALAPGGRSSSSATTSTNLTDGVGGPSDPTSSHARRDRLRAARARDREGERVLRDVDGEERDAIDALVERAAAAELSSAGKRSSTQSVSSGASR